MMIKARVAAGDRPTGRALLDFVEPKIYSTTLDFSAIEALMRHAGAHRTKSCRARKQVARNARSIDIKLERGGIRDIEFLVQCLQRLYGGADPGCATEERCSPSRACRIRVFYPKPNMAVWPRPINFCATWNIASNSPTIAKPTRCPPDASELELIARRMPAPGGGAVREWLLAETRTPFRAGDRDLRARGPFAPRSARFRARRRFATEQRRPRAGAARARSFAALARRRIAARLSRLRTFSRTIVGR